MPLRARNQLNAMVAIQDAAYELFADRAYDAVTVEEIALRSGVGPATVYRHFGRKERILTWNEHDDEIARLVVERLRSQRPVDALRAAFVEDVAPLVDNDRQRRQMRLLYSDPVLAAAATTIDVANIEAVSTAVCDAHPEIDPLTAAVIARAALGALEAAFATWQESGPRTSLASVVARAFDALEGLGQVQIRSGERWADPV